MRHVLGKAILLYKKVVVIEIIEVGIRSNGVPYATATTSRKAAESSTIQTGGTLFRNCYLITQTNRLYK